MDNFKALAKGFVLADNLGKVILTAAGIVYFF
jgi:hypothetical protein